MLSLQEHIRALVNQDQDCSEPSTRLLSMRSEMVELIVQRNAMGGGETCPNIAERLKEGFRPQARRHNVLRGETEKPGRSRALPIKQRADRAQTARPMP